MKLLYSKEQITQQVDRVAHEILRDYAGRRPLVVDVLKGAKYFFVDLTRRISEIQPEDNHELKLQDDDTTVSSYKHGIKSGDLKLVQDVDSPIEGRDVIVAEDILESAKTLSFLHDYYMMRGASSVEIVLMIRKKMKCLNNGKAPKYVCFNYDGDSFLVGNGLDNKGFDRNRPNIYEMEEPEIKAAPGA